MSGGGAENGAIDKQSLVGTGKDGCGRDTHGSLGGGIDGRGGGVWIRIRIKLVG